MFYASALLALAATSNAAAVSRPLPILPSGTAGGTPKSSGTPKTNSTSASDEVQGANGTKLPADWNLGNTYCATESYSDPKGFWGLVKGDEALEHVLKIFTDNALYCTQCYGKKKEDCPESQQGHPGFDTNCTVGLSDHAKGRFDTAVASWAWYPGLDSVQCDIQSYDCMAKPVCTAANGPSSWAVLDSISTVNNFFNNIWSALDNARKSATDQMTQFSKDFAPIDKGAPVTFFTSMLSTFASASGGLLALAPAGAGPGLAVSLAGSLSSGMLSSLAVPDPPTQPDTGKIMGAMVDHAQASLENIVSELFKTGQYTWHTEMKTAASTEELTVVHHPHDQNNSRITMGQLMKDGFGLAQLDNSTAAALKDPFLKALYQQLAHYTWQNLANNGAGGVHPFITFENQPCGKTDGALTTGDFPIIQHLDTGAQVDFDGKCYYLLAGQVTQESQQSYTSTEQVPTCTGKHTLPGGRHDILKGGAYNGLIVEDFVIPSVKGWQGNGNSNGWKPAWQQGIIKDIQDSGTTLIPVCDYVKDQKNPGKGCPLFGTELDGDGNCKFA